MAAMDAAVETEHLCRDKYWRPGDGTPLECNRPKGHKTSRHWYRDATFGWTWHHKLASPDPE